MNLEKDEPLRQETVFLFLLLMADSVFVLVHLAYSFTSIVSDNLFSLEQDRGYGEIFQYIKTFWVVALLVYAGCRVREPVFAAWALLYSYLLVDDGFQIHERGGRAVADLFDYSGALGLRAVDFGELTVSLVAGTLFFALILLGYLRSMHGGKNASQDLAFLLAALVFFGVAVDMLHVAAGGGRAETFLGLFEDAGEMVVMSLTCWYSLGLLASRKVMSAPFWRLAVPPRSRLVPATAPSTSAAVSRPPPAASGLPGTKNLSVNKI